MDIHVFKTSINSMQLALGLEKRFDANPLIIRWSVDIEDIDNVLRIESTDMCETEITQIVKSEGFACEPLPD